jgi:hypothetical protein
MTNTISYKGQTVILEEDPRIGVCNLCRAVMGEVDAQRGKVYKRRHHRHHEEYDDNDVLAHTIEACAACHRRIENQKGLARGGIYNKSQPRNKVIRLLQNTCDRIKGAWVVWDGL